MQFLKERECGYDPERLGFPSISGCLAVAYLAQDGLYGFHNNGGNNTTDLINERARLMAGYVRGLNKHAKGIHLYGASYIGGGNRRGYGGTPRDSWLAELKRFAKALAFSGPISGCDLGQLNTTNSAYVEFRRVGQSCLVLAKPWTDATSGKVTAANPDSPSHQAVRGNQYTDVITSIDVSGMTMLDQDRLK